MQFVAIIKYILSSSYQDLMHKKYVQDVFLRETKLLDDVATSEHPSHQLLKYPFSKFLRAMEAFSVFADLRKMPAAIQSFSRAAIHHTLSFLSQYYHN